MPVSFAATAPAPPALDAHEAADTTKTPLQRLLDGLEWRNIGPRRGGRSQTVAGHRDRPLEYFFGATGGGLWHTTDGGGSWEPVTDGQITSSSIGAIGWAPSNPDVIYIGGGETELRGSITQGDGVYRSGDGGKTWKRAGLPETQAIARIRVHPADENLVYVAALGHPYAPNPERGVFRSRDGGATWERILHPSDSAGAVDLILDPSHPSVIYATTWQVYRKAWKMWGGGPHSGLWKSTDGGDTWTELTRNPGMPAGVIGKIGITVSPADPNRLYAIVEAEEGGVFRSDDAGATWRRTNSERKIRQRHFYYSRIYADPRDPNISYALNTRLYKSTDAGVTYEALKAQPPHGDHHDLWIAPDDPARMIDASDGGGSVTVNGGKTWTELDFVTTQLYHVMATRDFPYHVCGAQQDNSTVCVPSEDWDHRQARGPGHGWYYAVGGGESGYITQSPIHPDVFYAGSQGALLTRYDRSNGQRRDIQPYPRFFSGEPASALPERWQWTFPIVFSPVDPLRLYITSQHVWMTRDDGQTWRKISPDLTLADPETLGETGGVLTMDMNGPEIYATVFALAPSRYDVNTIWAGSDDGLMHITRDGGASWQDITPPDMPHYTRVSVIEESKHAPGTAYVAANRYQVDDRAPYVWRTTDYGKSWTKIVEGIAPGHFARVVREDPERQGLLYLGTEHTVYVSLDAGDHWRPLTLDLPDTPIRDLVTTANDVVLGTHGRGFWILDDVQPLREWRPELAGERAHLFGPHTATRGVGPATIQYWLARDQDSVKVEILDGAEAVIRTFVGLPEKAGEKKEEPAPSPFFGTPEKQPTTHAGLNRFEWNLRYAGAVAFDSMIIWSARPQQGPKAPPGTYGVRLTVGGRSQTRPLRVRMDPRLEGVTPADLQEQWRLAMRIRDATSRADQAVIRIREVRAKLADRTDEPTLRRVRALSEIEEALYQVRNRSGQDPLNFPIRLNNRLAALRRSVETGDARPTDGAYRVFEELSAELDGHLKRLEALLADHGG
ncbi:MAG: WD40/YVTN/BNR-like repeat-containing protein [Gemmatimonadota bacterium]